MPKITTVKPMEEYRLEIGLDNGNTVILDLSKKSSDHTLQAVIGDKFLPANQN